MLNFRESNLVSPPSPRTEPASGWDGGMPVSPDASSASMERMSSVGAWQFERLMSSTTSNSNHRLRSVSKQKFTKETNTVQIEKCVHNSMMIINQYIILKTLGSGSYGKVKLCLNSFDYKLYAMKIVDKRMLRKKFLSKSKATANDNPVIREIAIMKKLSHTNIVNLIEVIDSPDGKLIYMLLEYIDGGPVEPPIGGYEERTIREILRDVCKGLDYLHYNKVAHRDLKPANLLRSAEGTVKIADFGVSQIFERSKKFTTTAGTPAFMAPELCREGDFSVKAADMWAVGVTLYNLYYADVPFKNPCVLAMYEAIQQDEFKFPDVATSGRELPSPELQNLIRVLLVKDFEKRAKLRDVMNHRFTSNSGSQPLESMGQIYPPPDTVEVSQAEIKSALDQGLTSVNGLLDYDLVERIYPIGAYLFRKGEPGNEMYFINSGEVNVLVDKYAPPVRPKKSEEYDDDDWEDDESDEFEAFDSWEEEYDKKLPKFRRCSTRKMQVLLTRGAGSVLGEMALLGGGGIRSADCRVKAEVSALVITKTMVEEMMSKNPSVKLRMQSIFAERENELLIHHTREKLYSQGQEFVDNIRSRGSIDKTLPFGKDQDIDRRHTFAGFDDELPRSSSNSIYASTQAGVQPSGQPSSQAVYAMPSWSTRTTTNGVGPASLGPASLHRFPSLKRLGSTNGGADSTGLLASVTGLLAGGPPAANVQTSSLFQPFERVKVVTTNVYANPTEEEAACIRALQMTV